MNAITQIPGIGHNQPPPAPIDLRTALEPKALAAMVAAELAAHTLTADTLIAEYERFVVKTAKGIPNDTVDAAAVDFKQEIKDEIDALDVTRKAIKEPVLAAQRTIDGAAKVISDRLAPAYAEVNERHRVYLVAKDAEVRRVARETADRAEEAAFKLRQEALETGEVEVFAEAQAAHSTQLAAEAVVFAPVLETTRMRTATGTLSGLKDNWTYALTDISQVPTAYLCVNDAVVKAAIRSGTRSIPGLRIVNNPKAR
jgi:hypothetical protein